MILGIFRESEIHRFRSFGAYVAHKRNLSFRKIFNMFSAGVANVLLGISAGDVKTKIFVGIECGSPNDNHCILSILYFLIAERVDER